MNLLTYLLALGSVVLRVLALRSIGTDFDPRSLSWDLNKWSILWLPAWRSALRVQHREWNGPFHYNVAGRAMLSKPVAPGTGSRPYAT